MKMLFTSKLEAAVVIVSLVSALSNGLVLLTGVMFKELRKRFFIRIIMMLAFTDLAVSIAGTFGFPPNGTWLCAFQGALEIFFLRANWLWTTMLVYQMQSFIVNTRVELSEFSMHVIVWSTTSVLTFIPLISAEYGREGANTNSEMCFLRSKNDDWFFSWLIIDWIAVLLCCILKMLMCIHGIVEKLRSVSDIMLKANLQALVNSLYLYPVFLGITWGSNAVINLVIVIMMSRMSSTADIRASLSLAAIISLTNGFWISLIFFIKCPEARIRWKNVLLGKSTTDDELVLQDNVHSDPSILSEVFLSDDHMRSSFEISWH